MVEKEKMKYFNPDNYRLQKESSTDGWVWRMKWKKSSDAEKSEKGFCFCIPECTLYLWMQALTDYRVIRISNNYTYLRFVDNKGGTIYNFLIPLGCWNTLNDNGDIPVEDYQPFVSLVTCLYERYAEVECLKTEQNMYDPSKYILQCDFEDDCFMVFAESSAEKSWGDREFSLALSETHFKELLAIFSNHTVRGIDFQVEDVRYGSGKLTIRTNTGSEWFPCENYSDISGSNRIRSLERIYLIHTLLQALYDKEFPNTKEESPDDNVPENRGNTTGLDRLTRLQEDFNWFFDTFVAPKYHKSREEFCGACEIVKEMENAIQIERENCNTK